MREKRDVEHTLPRKCEYISFTTMENETNPNRLSHKTTQPTGARNRLGPDGLPLECSLDQRVTLTERCTSHVKPARCRVSADDLGDAASESEAHGCTQNPVFNHSEPRRVGLEPTAARFAKRRSSFHGQNADVPAPNNSSRPSIDIRRVQSGRNGRAQALRGTGRNKPFEPLGTSYHDAKCKRDLLHGQKM